MPRKKKADTKEEAPVAEEFIPDAFVIRTTTSDGKAYGGFQWPMTVGTVVECPDWKPIAACGYGFHGNLDGVGDWGLLSGAHDALWWIVGVKRSECIDLSGKVKFPRGKIIYIGSINGALCQITKEWRRIVDEACKAATESQAKQDFAHASTAGQEAHASTAGQEAHASTAGLKAHASTAGLKAHASTAGQHSVSSGLGFNNRAKAAKDGAIVLVNSDRWTGEIFAIRASKVGENGIKPDTWYELSRTGEFQEIAE